MKEYRFLVPVDKEFGVAHALLATFGGYTCPRTVNDGAWVDDKGNPVFDKTVEFRVATNERKAFVDYCQHLCRQIGESCIYAVLENSEVVFIYPERVHPIEG